MSADLASIPDGALGRPTMVPIHPLGPHVPIVPIDVLTALDTDQREAVWWLALVAYERLVIERESLGVTPSMVALAVRDAICGRENDHKATDDAGDCETDCVERCQGPCGVSHLGEEDE